VRRLFRWIVGLASALAIWRLWSRRHRAQPIAVEPAPDPAEELRRKLAESRDETATAPADAPVAAETLEERRARVHAKAQEAIDAMHEDGA
jgi:hypothetical protein